MLCRGGRLPQQSNQRAAQMRVSHFFFPCISSAPQPRSLHSKRKAPQPHAVPRQSLATTVPRKIPKPLPDASAFRSGWSIPRHHLSCSFYASVSGILSGARVMRSLVVRNNQPSRHMFSTIPRPPTAPVGGASTPLSCSGSDFHTKCTGSKLATALRFIFSPFRLLLKFGVWCCLLTLAWCVLLLVLWWISLTVVIVWSLFERNSEPEPNDAAESEHQAAKSASLAASVSTTLVPAASTANAHRSASVRQDNDALTIDGAANAIAAVARSLGL